MAQLQDRDVLCCQKPVKSDLQALQPSQGPLQIDDDQAETPTQGQLILAHVDVPGRPASGKHQRDEPLLAHAAQSVDQRSTSEQ